MLFPITFHAAKYQQHSSFFPAESSTKPGAEKEQATKCNLNK